MCTPVAIGVAGLVASVAGSAVTAQQQSSYAAAQNRAEQQKQQLSQQARDAERLRQQQYDKQAMDNWNAELTKQGAGKVQEQVDQGQQQALDTTQQVQSATNADQGLLPGQTGPSVSDVFTKDVNRQVTERMADAKQRIAALAKLSGYDRANGYTSQTSNLFNADQGLLQSEAQRSARLGVQEGQLSTPWTTAPDTSFGSGLSGLGNLALGVAGSGKAGIQSIKDTFSGLF